MRHIFISLASILLVFIVSSCSPSKEKIFEEEAERQNRQYPMMVDPHTRIDSIRYIASENTFRYHYTLIGRADNADISDKKRDEMKRRLPAQIKQSAGLATHRKHKVIMEYVYFSESSGKELLRITVTPDMYE